MSGPEAKIERRVEDLVFKRFGIQSVKWGTSGWPDRIFLIPGGRPLVIEFKAPDEEPTPRQEFRIQCLRDWGYDVEVHDDAERAIQAVERAVAAARLSEKGSQVPARARVRRVVPGPGSR